HRALARIRTTPSGSGRGLPGATLRHDRLQADAVRILQRQSVHRFARRGERGELLRQRHRHLNAIRSASTSGGADSWVTMRSAALISIEIHFVAGALMGLA